MGIIDEEIMMEAPVFGDDDADDEGKKPEPEAGNKKSVKDDLHFLMGLVRDIRVEVQNLQEFLADLKQKKQIKDAETQGQKA